MLWGFFFLMLLAIVASKLLSMMWGADVDTLSYADQTYQFSASREPVSGTFQIEVEDEKSLWFAMGYVMGWDREFQSNLLRAAARGELSSLLGARMLNNDQLMRHLFIAAEDEMNSLPVDSLMRRAARAYVEGRNRVLEHEDLGMPIEYKMMGLERSDFSDWTEVDVFALARFHSWSLSYDHKNEQMLLGLKAILGEEKLAAMLPMDQGRGPSLYGQDYFKQKGFQAVKARAGAEKVKRSQALAPIVIPQDAKEKNDYASVKASEDGAFLGDENFSSAGERGASNLWVMAAPKIGRGLTLCNDTHLRLSWPSALYPMSYRLKGRVAASGFAMPGTPALVVGSFESEEGEALVLGITSGTLADSQDLIVLDKPHASSLRARNELFEVFDIESGTRHTEERELQWSQWGPVVNEIFPDWLDLSAEGRLVAMDSILFRESASPMEFFVKRNLFLGKEMLPEIHEKIAFPVLNLFWLHASVEGETKWGHVLTGDIWSRSVQSRARADLPSSSAIQSQRTLSRSIDREFFEAAYDGKEEFLVVSANQQVWPRGRLSFSSKNETSAYMWAHAFRAERIQEMQNENWRVPGFSQSDYFSPSLHKFYRQSRNLLDANRLCSQSPFGQLECLKFLGELDAFDGVARSNSWQTSVIALWHAHFKWRTIQLLGSNSESDEELDALVGYWQNRRGFTHPVVHKLLEEGELQSEWEGWTKKAIKEVLLESFHYSINTLSENYSKQWSFWNWGNLHRVSWLHPIAMAPEPIGTMFHDGVLGPSIGVSGALNSPGRFEYDWNPNEPLEFPATHGAASRFCAELATEQVSGEIEGKIKMGWASSSGPSGNPFSRFSKEWSLESYFQGELSPISVGGR